MADYLILKKLLQGNLRYVEGNSQHSGAIGRHVPEGVDRYVPDLGSGLPGAQGKTLNRGGSLYEISLVDNSIVTEFAGLRMISCLFRDGTEERPISFVF